MTPATNEADPLRRRGRRSSGDARAPLYVISVAAELTGVHAHTLRSYEREGLVTPARTAGGNRRYSDADLDRIERIAELTEAGIPLVGVRLILDLERRLAELDTPTTAPTTRRAARLQRPGSGQER